jgi:DNA-binding LytR/AlgR family response regulator
MTSGLSVLAVDDESPALDELTFLLEGSPMVSSVRAVRSSTEALHFMHGAEFDVILLDIGMPGLDGLELARVLSKFSHPPAIVFVTAHEEHALTAFDVGAVGYLLKPVTRERLSSVLDRVHGLRTGDPGPVEALDIIPIEIGTLTKMVPRDHISWVESAGDYVRLHLRDGSHHLVRLPISLLEEQWAEHGFARIHRSYLVALRDIRELRTSQGHTVVGVGDFDLPVSRRHAKELRDVLVRNARRPTK